MAANDVDNIVKLSMLQAKQKKMKKKTKTK